MGARITFLLWGVGLLAQTPTPENYRVGKIIKIESHPDVPKYEYTVFNLKDDAFTGASGRPLLLHERNSAKFAIQNGSIYFIDEDGKVQQTRYIKQAEVHEITIPNATLKKSN